MLTFRKVMLRCITKSKFIKHDEYKTFMTKMNTSTNKFEMLLCNKYLTQR